jgi:FkbM family methyltransferase
MDVLDYSLNTITELYRSTKKQTVYLTRDVLEHRLSEIKFKLLNQHQLDGFKIAYDKVSDVLGLYDEIFCYKCYDFKTTEHMPLIIDAGANIGMATLRFKKMYPHARIIAFEPQPTVYKFLTQNIVTNGLDKSVYLVNMALSDYDGKVSFNTTINGVTDCCASLADTPGGNNKIIVQVTRLPKYINSTVSLLKLDIEGSEYHVLRDLEASGKLKFVERIILEYHPVRDDKNKRNGYYKPIIDILDRNGFYYDVRPPHEMNGETYRLTYIDGFCFTMIYAARSPDMIQDMGGYALVDKKTLQHWPAWNDDRGRPGDAGY